MDFRRTIIAASIILAVIIIGYGLFRYGVNHEENLALNYYLQGDYKKSEKVLRRLYGFSSPQRYELDMAYIAKDKRQLALSNQYLANALKKAQDSDDMPFLLEVTLNQACNGFLLKDPIALSQAVSQAHKIAGISDNWVRFFRGLEEYTKGDYALALTYWSEPVPSNFLSPWMKKSFSQTFTRNWLDDPIARCKLEEDKNHLYAQSRELIKSGNLQELPSHIQTLEQMKANAEAAAIAFQFIESIQLEMEKIPLQDACTFAESLYTIIPDKKLRQSIIELFENELNRSLATGDRLGIQKYWAALAIFQADRNPHQRKENLQRQEDLVRQIHAETLLLAYRNRSFETELQEMHNLLDSVLEGKEPLAKLEEAVILLSEINDANPNIAESYSLLGQALFLLNQNQSSIEAYQKALRLNPTNLTLYKYLSLAYTRKGYLVEALDSIMTVLEKTPEDEEALVLLTRLFQNQDPHEIYIRLLDFDPDQEPGARSQKNKQEIYPIYNVYLE